MTGHFNSPYLLLVSHSHITRRKHYFCPSLKEMGRFLNITDSKGSFKSQGSRRFIVGNTVFIHFANSASAQEGVGQSCVTVVNSL